jgi:hypothetical protein
MRNLFFLLLNITVQFARMTQIDSSTTSGNKIPIQIAKIIEKVIHGDVFFLLEEPSKEMLEEERKRIFNETFQLQDA